MQKRTVSGLLVVPMLAIAALIAVGVYQTTGDDPMLREFTFRPHFIMGTESLIKIVAPADAQESADIASDLAERALRRVERLMSPYIDTSDIARINAAQADTTVEVSREVIDILMMAKRLHGETRGAFDTTCAPVIRLWKQASKDAELPSYDAVDKARELSNWSDFIITRNTVEKKQATAMIDLGAIAKGYAIDRAIDAIKSSGIRGGLVEVGGDIRCFGKRAHGGRWRIQIRDPFKPDSDTGIGVLHIENGAVCTSGDYRRFAEIDDKRYSHIINPKSGMPVKFAPSVTVFAPTAAVADAWATALSVLGPMGMKLIPEGSQIEVMLVEGTAEKHEIHKTDGFNNLLSPPPVDAAVGGPGKTKTADQANPQE